MRREPCLLACLLTGLLLVLTACAPASSAPPESVSTGGTPVDATDAPSEDGAGRDDASVGATEPASAGVEPDPAPTGDSNPAAGSSDEPSPTSSESLPPLVMTATLERDCVRAGEMMTLTVTAPQHTSVSFLAVYAGGENGATPPWGHGHGGNDGGFVGPGGQYRGTWTVSATAPVGPGHVQVAAAYATQHAEGSLPFEVVDAVRGAC
jgi:hypothetical protein